MPTMRAGPPSLCVPQSFPLIPHPKAASLDHMHPSCCLISHRLSRLYLHLLPEPAQSCPPSPPLLPLLMAPTHIHTPPRQSFTTCFPLPTWFWTSCHLPSADSPPSDSLHQVKKISLVGARLGCSLAMSSPSRLSGNWVTVFHILGTPKYHFMVYWILALSIKRNSLASLHRNGVRICGKQTWKCVGRKVSL